MHTYIHACIHTHTYTHTHIHTHTYMHTYIHIRYKEDKMADELKQGIDDALDKIVNTTDQSGNMRKDLKKIIYETVSTLRTLCYKLKDTLDDQTKYNKHLEDEASKKNKELDSYKNTTTKRHIETSYARRQEPPRLGSRQVLPPHDNNRKLYASVVATTAETKHKALVRSKINQTPEMIKNQLKTKVNPTEIGVGITSLKMLRDGRLMIEGNSKQEIEALGNKIEETCGAELEVRIQKRRNPRMVLLGIPEDITTENIGTTLAKQNPELDIKEEDIRAKFSYTTKRETKNLVIEVDSGTRKKLIQTRIKLGWTICRVDDYIVAKRCFRCSRFNHNFRDCRGEETCPLCTGSHKLRDCTATKSEYKCINCLTYNRHHQATQIDITHSSLDKSCPSLMAVLEKYKRNTDY